MKWHAYYVSLLLVTILVPAYSDVAIAASGIIQVNPAADDSRAQIYPDIAYGDDGIFLITWQQGRNYYQTETADILATRMDTQGRILDKKPITISAAHHSQERPQIAYANGVFLLVWQDLRNGKNWDVMGTYINREGKVLTPGGFVIAAGQGNQTLPIVATDGSRFLVIWQHYASQGYYQLHYALVSGNREIEHSGPVRYSESLSRQWWGYSPGWGYTDPTNDPDLVSNIALGGEHTLVCVDGRWLLSWNNEFNWSPGKKGSITRRFARLKVDSTVRIEEIHRETSKALGQMGGNFIPGKNNALFVSWASVNRGSRIATGALFDPRSAVPRTNPNQEPRAFGAGWNPKRTITLFHPGFPVDGPVSGTFSKGIYYIVARGAENSGNAFRIYLSRLTDKGKRLNKDSSWPLLHEGKDIPSNPVLAFGKDRLLLVFGEDTSKGRHRIYARIIEAE